MADILIIPNGIITSLAFTDAAGAVTIYSDAACETEVTQPVKISATTTYFTKALGVVRVVGSDRAGTTLVDKRVDTHKAGAFVTVVPEREYVAELANLRAGSANAQTGTAYTLALTDAHGVVECANASPITLTVPPNSSVAFPVGTRIDVAQTGAGAMTIAAGEGVTVNTVTGLQLTGQWAVATLVKRATNAWVAFGSLTTAE